MAEKVRGILLDIEGTTSSIRFVYDVMFPYVRQHLKDFLNSNWDDPAFCACLPLLADDLGVHDAQWPGEDVDAAKKKVEEGVISLMDGDVKATGLKQLQGLIWKAGFHSGRMVAHLYEDVAPAITGWSDAGVDVRIYSSGSIAAQKLFFGHTVNGDLLPRLSGHYDTTTGPKKEAASYTAIAGEFGIPAGEILFVSDVAEELDAASAAGMRTALSLRDGNKPVENRERYDCVESFAELNL